MPKSIKRTYSKYGSEAVTLLARLIRVARKQRKLTMQDVADRAGISRGLMQRIEKGNPRCEIGTVFEVASIVGVALFDEAVALPSYIRQNDERLALLPKSVRKANRVADDDF